MRSPRSPLWRAAGACAPVLALSAAVSVVGTAGATSLPVRTFELSVAAGGPANGPSADFAISRSGRFVAFDSAATNLGASTPAGIRNIYVFDVLAGVRSMLSGGRGGPANGDSSNPAVSADGSTVVWQSDASNLVAGDTNGVSDIFVRHGVEPIVRVSVASDDGQANGPSSEPAISSDGRFVAFMSSASNLVPGDNSHASEIFVRDLVAGTTTRVSVGADGRDPNGPSTNPALSADGRVVSFDSSATNLLPTPVPSSHENVYARTLATTATELVSVSTLGTDQNLAVPTPFHQISSLSADGRFVAFDSNADNLVSGDVNRSTDVFVRDRMTHLTTLASANNAGFEGNNDSFAPTISGNGRYVAFESFARNLASGGGPRENVFVRDLDLGTTSVIDVGPFGASPTAERVTQLLQHPVLSWDGSVAVFGSTALNLTHDPVDNEHVFLRLLSAPRGFVARRPRRSSGNGRPVIVLHADDRAATTFECRFDRELPRSCPAGRPLLLQRLRPGRHVLLARAGGPGMLYDPVAQRIAFTIGR